MIYIYIYIYISNYIYTLYNNIVYNACVYINKYIYIYIYISIGERGCAEEVLLQRQRRPGRPWAHGHAHRLP